MNNITIIVFHHDYDLLWIKSIYTQSIQSPQKISKNLIISINGVAKAGQTFLMFLKLNIKRPYLKTKIIIIIKGYEIQNQLNNKRWKKDNIAYDKIQSLSNVLDGCFYNN